MMFASFVFCSQNPARSLSPFRATTP